MQSRLPALRLDWRWVWRLSQLLAVALLLLFWLDHGLIHPHLSSDGAAYWGIGDGTLYEYPWLNELTGGPHPYVYSPVFAQVLWPLAQLPLPAFMAAWVGLQVIALAWLVGPVPAALLLLWPPIGMTDVWAGSLDVPLAAALALSLRYPGMWAFALLTKVTPGVGVLWHLVRREWRALAWAMGATAGIVMVSFLLWPTAWFEWGEVLRDGATHSGYPPEALAIPLAVRLPIAAAVVAVAGWRSWPWLLPVGVLLAMPQIGWNTAAVLLAIPRLLRGTALTAS